MNRDKYDKLMKEIKKYPLKTPKDFIKKLKQKIKEQENGNIRHNN